MPAPPPRLILGRQILGFARDESGATAVVVAVTLTTLMGFAGLAIDAGHWYGDRRLAQNAADAAAYSAAIDSASGDTTAGVTAAAKVITAQYGLTNGSNGVTVAVNNPPSTGAYTSTAGAWEVVITKTESLFFATSFINSASVSARGVAVAGSTGGKYCVQALDPSTSVTTVSASNGINIDASVCGLAVNGGNSAALSIIGGATIRDKYTSVVGGTSINNGGSLVSTNTPDHKSTADPYAGVAVPAPGACTFTNANYSSGGTTPTISPGTYCNGLSVSNGVSITMTPGVYIINGGTLNLQSGPINATGGVTIVLTGSGSNYATAQIGNGVALNLTAPTTGTTAGLAILQDPNAPSTGNNTFAGGATWNINGALYFPHQSVTLNNGVTNNGSCTQLIAWHITFAGGMKFSNTCGGTGTKGIGAAATTLVE